MVLCQFLVLAGNRFCFYILMYLEYKYSCVILKIRPKSYFQEGRRMSAQRNFDTPPKNWGIFRVVPPRHGCTQRRIYDLFFVRGFVVCSTFVQP